MVPPTEAAETVTPSIGFPSGPCTAPFSISDALPAGAPNDGRKTARLRNSAPYTSHFRDMLTFSPSVILCKFQRLQIFDNLPNFRGAQSILESRHPGRAALNLLPRGLLTPLGDQIIIEQRSISSVGRQRWQMADRAFLNRSEERRVGK